MNFAKSSFSIFQNYKLVVAVLVTGFLSGLLGVGGGVLLVPSMIVFSNTKQKTAHGTSLCAISVIAAAGLAGYIWEGSVNYWAGLFILGGSWLGASVGTWLLNKIETRLLKLIFGIFASVVAVRLFIGFTGDKEDVVFTLLLVLGCLLVGLFAGFLAGLFGVGGGIVIVPSLILLFEFIGADARGTSLLVVVPTAIFGTFRNARFKNVDIKLGMSMGFIGAVTAFAGSIASQEISERITIIFFGCLLVIVAVRMYWEYWRWQSDTVPLE